MDKTFTCLDKTINKSTITHFRAFLHRYPDVTKWFLCSDYCIGDKHKANDVISFVLYPYILDFNDWNHVQKTDLKNCRHVSDAFCQFSRQGYFFSISFILEKPNILDRWKSKSFLDSLLGGYIDMTERWQITTPVNADSYQTMNKKLRSLQKPSKNPSTILCSEELSPSAFWPHIYGIYCLRKRIMSECSAGFLIGIILQTGRMRFIPNSITFFLTVSAQISCLRIGNAWFRMYTCQIFRITCSMTEQTGLPTLSAALLRILTIKTEVLPVRSNVL